MKKLIIASTLAIAAMMSTASVASEFVISTGGEGGKYETAGNIFSEQIEKQAKKRKVELELEVVNSSGTIENIECLRDDYCQAAIIQNDGYKMANLKNVDSLDLHKEYVLWIYNERHGISDLEDIADSKKYHAVIVEDSGADVTLKAISKEDDDYESVYRRYIPADDNWEAAKIVSDGFYQYNKEAPIKQVAGMIYVGGKIPDEIVEDFSDTLRLGEATDKDFNDATFNGKELYESCEITDEVRNGMKENTIGDLDTVCVRAKLVYRNDLPKDVQKIIDRAATKVGRHL